MDKEFFYSTGLPPALHFEPMSSSSIPTWQLLASAMDIQAPELNCPSGQSPDCCYLNPSWEKSTDQNHHFDSARSSMVSSPVASYSNNIPNESFVLRELIGKLVNIRDTGGEISPQSHAHAHAHAHAHPLLGNISTASMATASYMSGNNSTNTSCYNTPLSSPPKLNSSPIMDHLVNMNLSGMENSMPLNSSLMEISGDPGFAERAARFSCFGSRSFNGRTSQSTQFLLNSNAEFPYGSNSLMGNGKMARVSSSPSLKALELKSPMQDGAEGEMRSVSGPDRKFSRLSGSQAEFATSPEESPVSEQIPGGESGMKPSNDMNSRKRKAVPRGKAKELAISQSAKAIKVAEGEDDSNAKRHKMIQGHGNENGTIKAEEEQKENTNSAAGDEVQEQTKTSPKPPEPLKDYIHVRARRGQATDSHSLAERVRREKIGERMKLLQDLVPGCNKVTGKALMLDEIINYVQSLQHQVEFLSMKLASVDFGTDSSMETHLSKDLYQSNGSLQHQVYGHQSEQRPMPRKNISNETVDVLDTVQYRNLSMQLPPLDGFSQGIPQFPTLCEDDLQSLVQMGLARI